MKTILVFLLLIASSQLAALSLVTYTPSGLKGYLCLPSTSGQSPAVLFNHGGKGRQIGGDPKNTCLALADAGYVGFSPLRGPSESLSKNLGEIKAGLEFLLAEPKVDKTRVAGIGFSRGGVLTYQLLAEDQRLKTAIIMAAGLTDPASGRNLTDHYPVEAPLLFLVARNDTGSRLTGGNNVFQGMLDTYRNLVEQEKAVELIVYPPYRDDGHKLFFTVGRYWVDVLDHLKQHL